MMRIQATQADLASKWRLVVLFVLTGAALFFPSSVVALPAYAQGTSITVNTTADEENTDGDCALREAIQAANTNQAVDACAAGSASKEDSIGFDLGSSSTITLDSQLPNIIDGAGLVVEGPKQITGSSPGFRALWVNPGAKLALRNLSFSDFHIFINQDGGAIYNNGGTLEVVNGTFSNNDADHGGGAILNRGTLEVASSTFSGNEAADFGGGIYNDVGGRLEVTNTTFWRNEANEAGGGILNWGPLTITNSTFSQNFAWGGPNRGSNIENRHEFWDSNDDMVTLRSTILADPQGAANCAGVMVDGGYNISDDDSCPFDFIESDTSMFDTDPKLVDSNDLQDNGGPTQTIALQSTSPAIDAIEEGVNGCATDITEDQRGVERPQGPACDIGALEAPLDVTVPEAPTIASPAEGSTLNTRSFSVSGTAEVNSTVELFEGTDSRGTGKTNRFGEWTVDLSGVSDGPHSYTAKATDRAGNISTESGARVVTVDTTAPEPPVITRPAEGSFDDDGFFFVIGSAEPGAEVELVEGATSKGTDTAGSDGKWGIALSRVTEGSHSYTVKATDGVGNVSDPSEARTVIVDTTAPDAPVIKSPAEGGHVTGSFAVKGTAEANGTVELLEGSTSVGTDKADSSGRWTIELTGVTERSHTYTAKAKDAAGNVSAASNARQMIVDTTAPAVGRVVPVENAIGIAPGTNVSAVFSEAMRAPSINNAFKVYKKGSTTAITATVTYDVATRRAVLNPQANLERNATYRAVVSAAARDLAGNQFDQNPSVTGNQQKVWFFIIRT